MPFLLFDAARSLNYIQNELKHINNQWQKKNGKIVDWISQEIIAETIEISYSFYIILLSFIIRFTNSAKRKRTQRIIPRASWRLQFACAIYSLFLEAYLRIVNHSVMCHRFEEVTLFIRENNVFIPMTKLSSIHAI